jgi:hypothetical protein
MAGIAKDLIPQEADDTIQFCSPDTVGPKCRRLSESNTDTSDSAFHLALDPTIHAAVQGVHTVVVGTTALHRLQARGGRGRWHSPAHVICTAITRTPWRYQTCPIHVDTAVSAGLTYSTDLTYPSTAGRTDRTDPIDSGWHGRNERHWGTRDTAFC